MADERDPNNPLDQMMPPTDNPEYHRKLKEHRDAQHPLGGAPWGARGVVLEVLQRHRPRGHLVGPVPRRRGRGLGRLAAEALELASGGTRWPEDALA